MKVNRICTNNAGRIRATGCTFAAFRPSNYNPPGINISTTNCDIILSAVFPNNPSYTYEWRWSVDGLFSSQYPGTLLGYGENLTVQDPLPYNCTSYFIQITVFNNSNFVAKSIRRLGGGVCTNNCCPCNENPIDFREGTTEIQTTESKILLYNITGEKITELEHDQNFQRLNLRTGIYFVVEQNGTSISSKKIFVHEN